MIPRYDAIGREQVTAEIAAVPPRRKPDLVWLPPILPVTNGRSAAVSWAMPFGTLSVSSVTVVQTRKVDQSHDCAVRGIDPDNQIRAPRMDSALDPFNLVDVPNISTFA